jgi:7,8-dihydropterin-6-yl-methyl-4-(beta-D-ribofuranosyl)aminobenzene 5'-phosphate synthase
MTMNESGRITVLVDDCVRGRDLLGEHGLAFWVEIGGRRLLFDTGQGMALKHNAKLLGVRLESANAVVLSHGHYDHTGGLGHMLEVAPKAGIYAHPAALEPKYVRTDDGAVKEAGMPSAVREAVDSRPYSVIPVERPTEIGDGVFVTGEIPRRTEYESTGGAFFADSRGQHADLLPDDQAMFIETHRGTIVLLGCGHAGVINTLQYVRDLTDGKPINTVVGGMHLIEASRDRMEQTIDSLRRMVVVRLVPGHCTGTAATAELWSALPGRCDSCEVGTVVEFGIR